jgi:hypothetical protein
VDRQRVVERVLCLWRLAQSDQCTSHITQYASSSHEGVGVRRRRAET